MRRLKFQYGFTLIELMIIVTIVGILTAVALPAYMNYLTRSKVTELLAAADACQTSVADYYQSQNTLPADTTASGCTTQNSLYISDLAVRAGAITLTSSAFLDSATGVTNGTFVLTPTPSGSGRPLTWSCAGSTIPVRYLPSICR